MARCVPVHIAGVGQYGAVHCSSSELLPYNIGDGVLYRILKLSRSRQQIAPRMGRKQIVDATSVVRAGVHLMVGRPSGEDEDGR